MRGVSRVAQFLALLSIVTATVAGGQSAKPATAPSGSAPVSTYAGNGYDAGTGNGGFTGDGGPATAAELYLPIVVFTNEIAFDSAGNLYIADTDNSRIRKVDAATGVISTVAGGGACDSGELGSCGDGGPATSASLLDPTGVAVDAAGDIYIADTFSDAIRRVDAKSGIITTVAGTMTCQSNPLGTLCLGKSGYAGDGGPATSALLNTPTDIALDSAGNLYIADTGNLVIREVAAGTGIISTVAGGGLGCAGETDATGDGCPASSAILGSPEALAFDATGDLYIAQNGNTTNGTWSGVREVNAKTGVISTFAGGGSSLGPCSAPADKDGDNCPATSALFGYPYGLAFDSSGDLWISDGGTDTVRVVDQTGTIQLAVGSYMQGFSGVTAATAEMYEPTGIAFDSNGNLYIADSENNVIRKVTYNSTPIVAAPTFSPTPGAYASDQSVVLSDSTSGATIYYTLDGTTPTTSSTQYGGAIDISQTTTVKAIAVETGYSDSTIATATYTIETAAATPIFSPAPGTYTSPQSVTISDSTSGATIYYTTDGGTPTTSSTKYSGSIIVSQTETIDAIAAASGYANSSVASAVYTITLPAAAIPTFSPAPGTYTSAQSVTLSDATTGATIYYTTDGSIPTTSSTKYTGPIAVSQTATINAIAAASGYSNSGIATGIYTINIAPPGFTLSALPASVSVAQGSSGTSTITITDEGGFSGTVALAATGMSSGVSASFANGSAAGTQVLTLAASASAATTSSPVTVTITGTSGSLSANTSVSLSVTAEPSFAPGSGGTTSMTVTPGATTGNTGTISVAGTNGFSGTVALTCSVTTSLTGVSDMPACSLNPASVAISGSTAQTSTLTVTTTAASTARNENRSPFWPPAGGATLALVLLFVRPKKRNSFFAMMALLMLIISTGLMACGGGGSGGGGGGGGNSNPGTTAGSYTITVTGTSGSTSATVGTVALTVQ